MTEQELREQVALGCRILAANGHDDFVWGHVSARDPEGRGAWMKASTFGFDEITAEHVILVGFDGEVLAGDHPCHIEWPIHLEILKARPDLTSVVHTHPPHSIAIAASAQPLCRYPTPARCSSPRRSPLHQDRRADRHQRTRNQVADTLAHLHALFLVNHGIVTAGRDIPDAVIRAVLLEKAAHQQMLTHAFGGPRRWSDDEEALRKRATVWSERQRAALWAYLGRRW